MAAKKNKPKPAGKKHPGGRPTSFKPEMITQARFLAERGCTDAELSEFFGVTQTTINNWKLKHPEFFETLKAGKEASDTRVERSLFERATGYSHPDVHISTYMGETIVTPIVKHYPPDTTAMIFWLKNRRPAEWRDKVDITANTNGPIRIVIGGDAT
jgi:hypothetical protein